MSKRPSASYNDPGYFYNQRKLLKYFAISSGILMLGILGIIWVDFDRPWKNEQRAQMKWEARKLTVEDFVLATRTRGDRRRLEKDRAKARETVEKRQDEIAELDKQVGEAEGTYYLADMMYKEQKQYTLEAEFNVHEAKSDSDLAYWRRKAKVERDKEYRLRDNVQMATNELNRLAAARRKAHEELDAIVERERKNAQLKRREILAANIEKKRSYNPAREIPLLDFLAAPTKVEQVVLENLVDNYEFAMPNKVDRCGTCHIGSMRTGFERAKLPVEIAFQQGAKAEFEPALYEFLFGVIDGVVAKVPADDPYAEENEKLRKVKIHHQVLELMWKEYDRELGEIGLDKNGDKIKKRWMRNKKGEWVVAKKGGQWIGDFYLTVLQRMEGHWRTHPHFADMVGGASPHPYEEVGCTICHLGRGWSTDFGYAWHSPDRVQVDDWMTEERVEKEHRHLPLNAEYGLEEAMRKGIDSVAEDEATHAAREASLTVGWVQDKDTAQRWKEEQGRSKNKLKYWMLPQHPKMLVQSACLKCHKEGLYRTPEEEYAGVRIGRPDPNVPVTLDWEDHSLAFNEAIAAEAPNRMFIPKEEPPYRPANLERGLDHFLRFGCYGCHKLDAELYPFMEHVRPKIGPPLDEVATKTNVEWARKWVFNPKDYRPQTRMPRFWGLSNNSHDFGYLFADEGFDTVDGAAWAETEAYAIVEWMWKESEGRARKYPPVELSKGDPKRGEQLILGDFHATEGRARGCVACHDVPIETEELRYDRARMAAWDDPLTKRTYGWKARMSRRQGPDLDGIGSKVAPEWLYAWLKSPRGYWAHTNMPDLRLSDQEALDITAYLMRLKHDKFDAKEPLSVDQGLVLRMAQELKVGEQRESTEAALNIVKRWSEEERTLYVGSKLFKHYGCFGCHVVEEYKDATPIGTEMTEWGSKLLERLEFNHAPIDHTRFDFAYAKMRNPRIYDLGMPRRDRPYERIKMPRFGFTPEEARDVATFLVGLVNDPIPEPARFRPDERQSDIIRGRQVVRRYNCQACHIIEGEGADIFPIIEKEKWKPPNLIGQGIKTQPDWLFHFFKNPAFVGEPGDEDPRVRPWHSIRMPSFQFTDEEARALVRYFAALSGGPTDFETALGDTLTRDPYAQAKALTYPDPADATKTVRARATNSLEEARALLYAAQCLKCHSPDAALDNSAPSFRHTLNGRLRGRWLVPWLWTPGKILPGTSMPAFFVQQQQGKDVPLVQLPEFFESNLDRQLEALRDYMLYHYRTEEDR